jgi:hypothetical protein
LASPDERSSPEPAPSPKRHEEAAYATSDEHLWDELRRIDCYLRAQVVRWEYTHGQRERSGTSDEDPTRGELRAYLRSTFSAPQYLPQNLELLLAPHWGQAKELADEIAERQAQTPDEVRLRVAELQRLCGLSDLERDIALVCLLSELDERYRRLFRLLEESPAQPPTVGLALEILSPQAREPARGRAALAAQSPLCSFGLVTLSTHIAEDAPLPAQTIWVDDRIAAYLLGDDRPDRRLAGWLMVEQPAGSPTSAETGSDVAREVELRTLARWWQSRRGGQDARAAVLLVGPDEAVLRDAARRVAARAEIPLLVVHVDLPPSLADWRDLLAVSYREAMLQGGALYWSGCEALLARDQPFDYWQALISAAERFPVLTFLASHAAWDPADAHIALPFLRLELSAPESDLRLRQWEAQLPPGIGHPSTAELLTLTERLTLSAADLKPIVQPATFAALADAADNPGDQPPEITLEQLEDAIARKETPPAHGGSSTFSLKNVQEGAC